MTRICAEAFKGCLKLDSITIPEGVVEMESGIFRNCLRLKYIKLPQTLKHLAVEALLLTVSTYVASISPKCLFHWRRQPVPWMSLAWQYNCGQPEQNVWLRDGCNAIVETATDKIISGCGKTRIVGSIKEIGSSAFGNSMIKSITIPANITKIHNGAFWGCRFCTSISVIQRILCMTHETIVMPS